MDRDMAMDDVTTFTVGRIRHDEENGICLISGADDEAEPAGYFIIQIEKGDPDGPLIEVFGEDLTQSDGVLSLEIGVRHLLFTFEPTSPIGTEMPAVRIESETEIAPIVRTRLTLAFGKRVARE